MPARPPKKPVRRRVQSLSLAERIVLRLDESRAARWLTVSVIVAPVLVVASIFWASSPGALSHDVTLLQPPKIAARSGSPEGTLAMLDLAPPHPAGSFVIPAEFERQQAMFLGCNELVQHHPRAMVEIIAALQGRLALYGLIEGDVQKQRVLQLLAERGLSDSSITLLEVPMTGMWVRDSGPNILRRSDGTLTFLDTGYLDGLPNDQRPKDDQIPLRLAAIFKQPVVSVPMSCEGGNILSNGQGIGITTDGLIRANAHRSYETRDVGRILSDYFGFQSWVVVPSLVGEPTSHIDIAVALTAPNVAVVSQLSPAVDPENARILDRYAELLAQAQTRQGPMRVERIPMPTHADGLWRSYTNVIFANGAILVPTYPDVAGTMDQAALQLYARLLPNWKVIPIDCSTLVRNHGMLRCVSANVPWPTAEPIQTASTAKP